MAHLPRTIRRPSTALVDVPSTETFSRVVTNPSTIDASRLAHQREITAASDGARNALTASGIPERNLNQLGLRSENLIGQDDDIWRYYDGAAGGETWFFINRVRNLAARVELRPERWDAKARLWVPEDHPEMVRLVSSLRGPNMSQPNLLAQATALMALTGHFRLLARPWPDEDGIAYEALSTVELTRSAGNYQLRRSVAGALETLREDQCSVAWIWRGGLERSGEPESSVRVALPILRMLERLNLSLSSIAESRLKGAGILLVARELDRKAPVDGKPTYRFADELEAVMMASLSDQGIAASRVPITVEIAHQMVKDGIRHIDLSQQSDEAILGYIDHYLVRLARAFSWPDEGMVPGGAADLNHWTAWWVGEREYSDFFRPLMDDVCHSGLTPGWFHPILRDNGIDTSLYRIGYDASAIRRKSEDVDKAVALRNAKIISARTALVVAGMNPDTDGIDDKDDEAGRRDEMLNLVSKFTVYGAVLLPRLGYELTDEERDMILQRSSTPEPAADGTVTEHPGPNPASNTGKGSPDAEPAPQPGDSHYRPPAGSGPSSQSSPSGPRSVAASAVPPPIALPAGPPVPALGLAVAAVIDSAIWAAWTRAGNRIRNKGRSTLTAAGINVNELAPEDVGRRLGRHSIATFTDLFDEGWALADLQLIELVPDPKAFVALATLMRDVAEASFYAPRPAGARIVDLNHVIGLLA